MAMMGSWSRSIARRRSLKPATADILLTIGVIAIPIGVLLAPHDRPHLSPTPSTVALMICGGLLLLARRRYPLVVLVMTEVVAAVNLPFGSMTAAPSVLACAITLYTVASTTERQVSLRLACVIVGINLCASLIGIVQGRPDSGPSFFFVTAAIIGSWSLGDNVRTRRAYLAQLEERARRLEMEQEEHARQAVQEERTRIARELHDVVAHHVSAIAVQAGAAAEIATHQPQRAREALQFIQETSRLALSEMRALLNVLRSDDDLGPERAPQPSLSQVDRLVSQSRAAGLPVTLQIEGNVQDLPEALDLSAYRIVQEALTNSLRHAGPAEAHVTVRYADDMLELEISDDGRGSASRSNGPREGRGLIGMRERVALFGGDMFAGSPRGQGFVVRVHLPLRSPALVQQ